ncbi:MAG: DoxX family protein [Deltaproteobacteria bacterium]|nr:DoxX family protein [Deltaproteobacteria bacterium]
MILNSLGRYRNIGLLILRLGIGAMFVYHGAPKMLGGPAKWEGLGRAAGIFGIDFAPVFWGFMAAVSEFAGGFALILGLFSREFSALLVITMIVAAGFHLNRGEGLFGASHAVELGIVFFSFIFIGPGKYSLDERLRPSRGAVRVVQED